MDAARRRSVNTDIVMCALTYVTRISAHVISALEPQRIVVVTDLAPAPAPLTAAVRCVRVRVPVPVPVLPLHGIDNTVVCPVLAPVRRSIAAVISRTNMSQLRPLHRSSIPFPRTRRRQPLHLRRTETFRLRTLHIWRRCLPRTHSCTRIRDDARSVFDEKPAFADMFLLMCV